MKRGVKLEHVGCCFCETTTNKNIKQLFHGGSVISQNFEDDHGGLLPEAEAPRGNGFDYSHNSHEITVLLPNNNIYTRYPEYSIRLTLHISSKSNWTSNIFKRYTSINEEVGNFISKTLCILDPHSSTAFVFSIITYLCSDLALLLHRELGTRSWYSHMLYPKLWTGPDMRS